MLWLWWPWPWLVLLGLMPRRSGQVVSLEEWKRERRPSATITAPPSP
jgi:hypothetical protein